MEIAVESPEIIVENPVISNVENSQASVVAEDPAEKISSIQPSGVSAFSLASIRAKRELQEKGLKNSATTVELPTEKFSDTDMLLHWNKYAQRLGDKGYKIMESLMLIGDPKLDGSTIVHELPNEGSRIDFESEKGELRGYLRGKLQNHNIEISLIVNEKFSHKRAFTQQDKFNRLNEINPSVELLRRTFDLDI